MIKKIIYTIGLMMFMSGPLHPWISQAAPTDEKAGGGCNSLWDNGPRGLECRFGRGENTGLDWGDSFGAKDPNAVGQNLYQIIYAKTAIKTEDAALQATADQYGMRLDKMTLIVGGNLSVILERNPVMRIDDAKRIYNTMMETYRDKKDSIELEANIKAKVEPNEIFADGDLGNSGFDLINDLNNIEIILFKKAEVVSIGGNHPNGADDKGDVKLPDLPGPNDQNLNIKPTPVNNSGEGGSNGSGNGAGAGDNNAATNDQTTPKNPFETSDKGSKAGILDGMNPNQCFASNSTKNALDNFQKDLQTNAKLQSTYVAPVANQTDATGAVVVGGGTGNGGNNGSTPLTNGGANSNGLIANNGANTTPTIPQLEPAKSDNWDKAPFCDGMVCISLDFVMKPATPAFNKTDNCIQCHVQYINDSIQKTISHSLIPGKAAGNLGESGLCKNAAGTSLGSVGMNVSLSLVPIITPAKNEMLDLSWDMGASKSGKELITKTSKEWDLYSCKQNPQKCLDDKAAAAKKSTAPTPTALERELIISVSNASDDATQTTIWSQGRSAVDDEAAKTNKELLILSASTDAMAQTSTIQALDKEMKQMNMFFDTFRKLFMTLNETVPGMASTKACEKLKNKEMCT